jgi:predicted peptidase
MRISIPGFLLFTVTALQLTAQTSTFPEPRSAKVQQARAKGDQYRTYEFPGTGETLQYRLFVPSTWTPDTKMPLFVELHAGATVDLPFQRGDGALTKVAERRGYIVVAPVGHKIAGGSPPIYNSSWMVVRALTPEIALPAATTKESVQDRARAEQDVLNVIDLVAKEYNVDSSRIYMHGNSHAGSGVWHMAQKYPQRWAAIAVSSGAISSEKFPFDRLRSVPAMIVHGTDDSTMSFDAALKMALTAKEQGVNVEWFPVPGGTHLEAWTTGLDRIIDFFEKHRKK